MQCSSGGGGAVWLTGPPGQRTAVVGVPVPVACWKESHHRSLPGHAVCSSLSSSPVLFSVSEGWTGCKPPLCLSSLFRWAEALISGLQHREQLALSFSPHHNHHHHHHRRHHDDHNPYHCPHQDQHLYFYCTVKKEDTPWDSFVPQTTLMYPDGTKMFLRTHFCTFKGIFNYS